MLVVGEFINVLRFCFTSILLVFSAIAQANTEKPTLIALELPGLTDAEKKGVFSHVYYALQEKALIKSWEAAPIFRAHQKFLSKKAYLKRIMLVRLRYLHLFHLIARKAIC